MRKDGRRLRIQAKPLRILELLLERPGDVVMREELRRMLWPPDVFVDFDRNLNSAVNKLREALGALRRPLVHRNAAARLPFMAR